MAKTDYPATRAIRALRREKIHYTPYLYPYQSHGGTHQVALLLNVPEHAVIKTLVMEIDAQQALLVLMHGDREVSTKQLARELGVKRLRPCDPVSAEKHTGFSVGGISPFGTRKRLPVYVEASVFKLERIFINGGKRGFMIEINPHDLRNALPVTEVAVAI